MLDRWGYAESGEEREETTFVDCSCFGKGGEIINEYCAKGKRLLVSGRLKLDQWEDKTTGQKRSKLSVIVDQFNLIDFKDRDDGDGESRSGGYGKPARSGGDRVPSVPRREAVPAKTSDEAPFGGDAVDPNDIPF